jgi:Peptidase family M23
MPIMCQDEYQASVAAFIRTKGITRCPTACALPTQGTIAAADRAALHGNGISTIYGHMHRYMVSVGQRVVEHTQIGSLGSTGRSSGPHVHYEILVNGEPQDPERFIGLARLISVTER